MSEKTVVITEKDGSYQIENNGIAEFALLGILECIVFEIKSVKSQESKIVHKEPAIQSNNVNRQQNENIQKTETVKQETKRETVEESAVPDIRTRISNAIKAIRTLGGKIEDTDLSNLTDEELQSELEELTSQYKRLKSSKANK